MRYEVQVAIIGYLDIDTLTKRLKKDTLHCMGGTVMKRLSYFDVAKGIGIVSVILGHMSIGWINTIVFTFHMPLFFIISGYFIKKKPGKAMIAKKARQLLIPYCITCLTVICLVFIKDMLLDKNDIIQDVLDWLYAAIYGSGNNYVSPFYIKSIGAIWFLLAMLIAQVLYNYFMDKQYCLLVVLICVAFGFVTVKFIYLPWSIQSAMFALIFIHIGNEMKQRNLFENQNSKRLLLALFIWLICMYVDKGQFYLVGNYSKNIFVDILGGVAGSYFIIGCSKGIVKIKGLGFALRKLGENSLIILCLHLVELNLLPWEKLWTFLGLLPSDLTLILTIVVKMIWCVAGTIFILKILVIKNKIISKEVIA